MKNKTKIASKMFLESMRQVRVIGIVMGVILLLQAIFGILSDKELAHVFYLERDMWNCIAWVFFLIPLNMASMTGNLFGWINKRNESDFYHSLPIKRSSMLIINIATVLIWTIGLYIVTIVVFIMGWNILIPRVTLVGQEKIWGILCVVLIMGMMLSGAYLIAMNIVKSRGVAALVAGIIIWAPRGFIEFIKSIIGYFFESHVFESNIIWDSSINLMFIEDAYEYFMVNDIFPYISVCYSIILGIIYWVIASLLFVHRKSEVAEKSAYNETLSFIIKLLVPLGISFIAGMGALHINYGYSQKSEFLFMVILTVAVYVCIQIVSYRSIKGILKIGPGLIIMLALNILLFVGIKGYVDYQKAFTPNKDEIESVILVEPAYDYSHYQTNNMPEDRDITGIELKKDEVNKYLATMLRSQADNAYPTYHAGIIKITANGRTEKRYINYEGYITLLSSMD